MAKKKQSKPQQQQLSPVRFLKERVRQVPVYKCYISKSLVNETEGSIMVVRKHTDGGAVAFAEDNDEVELIEYNFCK